jgi:hypothetical protein
MKQAMLAARSGQTSVYVQSERLEIERNLKPDTGKAYPAEKSLTKKTLERQTGVIMG